MPLNGVVNLPDRDNRRPSSSSKPSTAVSRHESHESDNKRKFKSKSSSSAPPAMPFMQQMQLLQALEGGRLEDHIRRHHKHLGGDTLEEARNRGFKDGGVKSTESSRGYVVTDEQGMMWFDEEEQWEFKKLLPKADSAADHPATVRSETVQPAFVTPKPTRLRKLFGASKKPAGVITGWETFDQSGRADEDDRIETDDENGGISPGVNGKLGFIYPSESSPTNLDKNFRRNATSFQRMYVPQEAAAGALRLPPPPQPLNTSRKKHPVLTHTASKVPPPPPTPSPSSQSALNTMSHNQLKKEFLAQAFTPSVSLPATRSHTPASNSQSSLPLASRSQSSLALPPSNSTRSVYPFAKLRNRKASISGGKPNF